MVDPSAGDVNATVVGVTSPRGGNDGEFRHRKKAIYEDEDYNDEDFEDRHDSVIMGHEASPCKSLDRRVIRKSGYRFSVRSRAKTILEQILIAKVSNFGGICFLMRNMLHLFRFAR